MKERLKKLLDEYEIDAAIYYKELKSGKVFLYNENKKLPSASLIKLFIMAHAFKKWEEEKISLDNVINIKEEDKVEFSIISSISRKAYSLKDLITLMIIQSDNTATNVLINYLGMDQINLTIDEFGAKQTILQRKMMDFYARKKGVDNYTCAKDIGELLCSIYSNEILISQSSNQIFEIMKNQIFSDMIPRYLGNEYTIANKTGDLPGINHDAAYIFNESSDSVLVIMTWGGKDKYKAKECIGRLAKLIINLKGE